MSRKPRRIAVPALAALALAVPIACSGSTAQASTLTPTHTTVAVTMHGNGHGHGMSQYGAQGAAIAGLSAAKIVGFYYPGTVLHRLSGSNIRVKLSSTGTTVTVAPASRMWVHGMSHYLPTTGVRRYRLVANSGRGVTLQQLSTAAHATWRTVVSHLSNGIWFRRHLNWPIRVYRTTGTSISYRGALRAYRAHRTGTTGGVSTVNVVSLDSYTAGVVPREIPVSWRHAAVEAQAIAARTYGRYSVKHPRSSTYDICDTTMCQVYGGAAKYDSHGKRLWSEATWAAAATSNQVLRYRGSTIFAQFSASNGGWTAAGGQPYLVSKRDPYDNARSGDPYLSYRRSVATRTIAAYYGLAKLTRIEVVGHTAGGRITTAYVTGVTASKHTKRVKTDGSNLSWAVGAGTTWLSFANS